MMGTFSYLILCLIAWHCLLSIHFSEKSPDYHELILLAFAVPCVYSTVGFYRNALHKYNDDAVWFTKLLMESTCPAMILMIFAVHYGIFTDMAPEAQWAVVAVGSLPVLLNLINSYYETLASNVMAVVEAGALLIMGILYANVYLIMAGPFLVLSNFVWQSGKISYEKTMAAINVLMAGYLFSTYQSLQLVDLV